MHLKVIFSQISALSFEKIVEKRSVLLQKTNMLNLQGHGLVENKITTFTDNRVQNILGIS